MSIVGTRPPLISETNLYEPRHKVKQIFYSKPFVITQKKREKLAVSIYLVQMMLADGLYWLIRDYYHNNQNTARPL